MTEQDSTQVPHGTLSTSEYVLITGMYIMLAVLLGYTFAYESGWIL